MSSSKKGRFAPVFKHHAINAYEEVKANLNAFLTLKQEGCDGIYSTDGRTEKCILLLTNLRERNHWDT
jgi:hypothetical protein